MSVGLRLREERARLGLSQPAFAALAGASKGAQQNWEKDAASPNASALIAFAEAGADVLYILTGRRTGEGPELGLFQLTADLAGVRRDLLEPGRYPKPGETSDQTEERVLQQQVEMLELMLQHQNVLGTPGQVEEAKSLLEIAKDHGKLAAFRAAAQAQLREKRARIRQMIVSWVELSDLQPSDASISTMVDLSLQYAVPLHPLMEITYQLLADGREQSKVEGV